MHVCYHLFVSYIEGNWGWYGYGYGWYLSSQERKRSYKFYYLNYVSLNGFFTSDIYIGYEYGWYLSSQEKEII